MISTGAMVQVGKCYGNLMVDLKVSNQKLKARALKLLCDTTQIDTQKATSILVAADWNVKTGILMSKANVSAETAIKILVKNNGKLAIAIEKLNI